MIPWVLLLAFALPFPALIATRLHMPLQDTLFARIDQSLGVRVPDILEWAKCHRLGKIISDSYPLVFPFLAVAVLAPVITGKVKYAREFVLANLAAYAMGLFIFALLPAIGPWYSYGLVPNSGQAYCQSQIFLLRDSGLYTFLRQPAGVVCFPSFHVIWAILCAATLWGLRAFRIPVALLSGLIVASTLTTGWHYFCDVLSGIAVACLSIAFAKKYSN